MLDSGGGGGGGVATPWYDYALPQMWQIVNGQDTERLWQQASGWKKTTDLTSFHLSNLQEYKDQLAEAWPPERSEASRAYMAELDKLIASVQETHDAASANYTAVVNMALAASDAKYKLKPLYDEYVSNQQKLDDYQQQVDAYNSDTTAMPQPSPGPSPVPNGRQEELNSRARNIMYGIGSEITTAGAALKPPARYNPPPGFKEGDSQQPNGNGSSPVGGGGMLVPPVIPPVRPAPSPTPTLRQPTPPSPPPGFDPPGIGQGPILGGVNPPPPIAPPGTQPPIIQPAPSPGPPPVGLPPGGLIGRTPPMYGPGLPPPATTPTGGLVNRLGGPVPKALGGTPGRLGARAMPPGGVIGGSPGAGLARPGAGRPMSRVNPPGGVIGGKSGGVGKAAAGGAGKAVPRGGAVGSGAAGGRGAGVVAGRSGKRRDGEEPVQHWDPDNPWETEDGVAPVVLPPDEPGRHDPGPAIGQGR